MSADQFGPCPSRRFGVADRPLRRFCPPPGRYLTFDAVRGPWRPSGAVAGAGVFAVLWSTRHHNFWAALHDFEPADQLRFIAQCRWVDRVAGHPGAWPQGRLD